MIQRNISIINLLQPKYKCVCARDSRMPEKDPYQAQKTMLSILYVLHICVCRGYSIFCTAGIVFRLLFRAILRHEGMLCLLFFK